MNNQERQALIERLNIVAEKLKWHNVNFAQDVCLAVKELTSLEAPQPEPVYQLIDDGKWYDTEKYLYDEAVARMEEHRKLYTAPPTPVMQPVRLPPAWWVSQGGEELLAYPKGMVIEALRAAGYPIEE